MNKIAWTETPDMFECIGYEESINTEQALAKQKHFVDTEDSLYYKSIRYAVEHLVHKFKLGLISKRQIIYSSTECLSTIHLQFSESYLTAFVYQRSCNYEKSYVQDTAFICKLLLELCGNLNLSITYKFGNLHKFKNTEDDPRKFMYGEKK